MLTELISEKEITVKVEASDWEDAIRKSAQALLDNGSIEDRYITGMIQTVKELGPYIVIAPAVAIAHARPECGVLRTDISLATLKTPICFGHAGNDPVSLVITLAARDSDEHLDALADLAELLSDSVRFQAILKADTPEQIYNILSKNTGEGI